MSGGKISEAVRETDADLLSRRGSKIPGPGHYDTDHIFGIYSRIMTATMDSSFATSGRLKKHNQVGLDPARNRRTFGPFYGLAVDPWRQGLLIRNQSRNRSLGDQPRRHRAHFGTPQFGAFEPFLRWMHGRLTRVLTPCSSSSSIRK